jgi:hypothetical protein
MVDDLRAFHVQLRLAGLQKLQQSKPVDFVKEQKDDQSLKNSCTFTPQIDPLFTMSGKTTCNLIHNGKIFNNSRLRPTNADGIAVNGSCYIRIPSNEDIDTDTRKAVLSDVIEILEAVGEKVDTPTLKKIDELKASIDNLKQQKYQLEYVTLPESQQQEKAKYQEYLKANSDYQTTSYQMDSDNPSSVYNVYYSLLGQK